MKWLDTIKNIFSPADVSINSLNILNDPSINNSAYDIQIKTVKSVTIKLSKNE